MFLIFNFTREIFKIFRNLFFRYGSSILLNRTDIETFESLVEAKAVVGLPFVVEQPRWAVLGFAKVA